MTALSASEESDVFYSKIDWWLLPLPLAPAVLGNWRRILEWVTTGRYTLPEGFWMPFLIFGLVVVAFIPISYRLEGNTVSIRCGWIGWEIGSFDVGSVTEARPSRSLFSAPALSLDRLRVETTGRDWLISPRRKRQFLERLTALDPGLQFDGRTLRRIR